MEQVLLLSLKSHSILWHSDKLHIHTGRKLQLVDNYCMLDFWFLAIVRTTNFSTLASISGSLREAWWTDTSRCSSSCCKKTAHLLCSADPPAIKGIKAEGVHFNLICTWNYSEWNYSFSMQHACLIEANGTMPDRLARFARKLFIL